MLENKFQADLIIKIKKAMPNAIVLKNDPNYIQGIPDLIILNGPKWGMLECKKNTKASKRPNQDYYVNRANEMSFGKFICPENEEEVLNELQQALGN